MMKNSADHKLRQAMHSPGGELRGARTAGRRAGAGEDGGRETTTRGESKSQEGI